MAHKRGYFSDGKRSVCKVVKKCLVVDAVKKKLVFRPKHSKGWMQECGSKRGYLRDLTDSV